MKEDTILQHPVQVQLEPGNRSLISPIYQSVKFTVDKIEKLRDQEMFFYTRISNPTTRELELQLARLQGTEDAVAVASGCAALSVSLLSLLKAGDHVVLFIESYAPLRYLVRELLKKFGVESTLCSIAEKAEIQKAIRPTTRLMLFESPTNPMTHIADIDFLVGTAKKHGILTLLDNTFAGPLNHKGCGADLYVHSLTKFISGHGDVMGGAILGSKELLKTIRHDATEVGTTLDPHTSALISRGLKTYSIRRERQVKTALEVAQWLEQQTNVSRVWYPGLKSHPGFEQAKKQMKDSGAVIAFDLRHRPLNSFFDALKLFTLAGSLGSCESLAAPVQAFYARDLTPDQCAVAGISEHSVRLSIGLEATEDLTQDLAQALRG
jgi:methionine-gamma-lyase